MNPIHSKSQRTLAMRVAAVVLAGGLLGAVAVTTGCVAVAAGTGAGATVAYVRGDLEATVNARLDKAVRAVNAAVTELKFAKISEKQDALQTIILARNAADKRIEIRVEQAGAAMAKVKIRVGVFGDEALSLAILNKIKANL